MTIAFSAQAVYIAQQSPKGHIAHQVKDRTIGFFWGGSVVDHQDQPREGYLYGIEK